MNIFHTNNSFLVILCFLVISACSSKTIYDKLKPKTYKVLTAENIDENNIILNSLSSKKFNIEKNIILKKIKNNNFHISNIIVENSQIFAINNNNELLEFNFKTGELISSIKIPIKNYNEDYVTSFKYIDNYFIVAFKSGLIIKIKGRRYVVLTKLIKIPCEFFEKV